MSDQNVHDAKVHAELETIGSHLASIENCLEYLAKAIEIVAMRAYGDESLKRELEKLRLSHMIV